MTIGEWVISRQRVWGVNSLPVFCAENGEIIMTKETVNHVADLFAEHGSNVGLKRSERLTTRRIYIQAALTAYIY